MKSIEQRRSEAIERNIEHSKRTLEQKIANCCSRRGKSQRELARLRASKVKAAI